MESPQYFTVTKVIGTDETQWGPKVAFKTNETGDHKVTTFTKWPENIKEGAKVYGHIETKPKDDGSMFYNFKWDKDPNSRKGGLTDADKAQILFANRNANAALAEVKMLRTELESAGVLKATLSDGSPVPDFSGPRKCGHKPHCPGECDPELASLAESAGAAMG